MTDSVIARRNMLDCQIRPADIANPRLLAAMGAVPRELFVPAARRALAYAQGHVQIAPGRYLLDPLTFGSLLKAAGIKPNEVVLIIGGGDGYSGAVISRLAEAVLSLECDPELLAAAARQLDAAGVDTVAMLSGPLTSGYPDQAPYDVILVNGAIERGLERLTSQLRDGGRLVCVEYDHGVGHLRLYRRDNGSVSGRTAGDLSAPVLPGFEKVAGFQFS